MATFAVTRRRTTVEGFFVDAPNKREVEAAIADSEDTEWIAAEEDPSGYGYSIRELDHEETLRVARTLPINALQSFTDEYQAERALMTELKRAKAENLLHIIGPQPWFHERAGVLYADALAFGDTALFNLMAHLGYVWHERVHVWAVSPEAKEV